MMSRTEERLRVVSTDAAPRTRVIPLKERTLRKHRIVAPFLGQYEADVFRTLRTLVSTRMTERGARTLGICSAREGEGKSMVALNFAISSAFDVNHTILLVELDFRWPRLHQNLGIRVTKGLADVLSGNATIAECLINPGYERLSVLPARATLARSSETLASPAMAEIAKELRERYPDRIIIYDLPPVLLSDDCLAFMQHLDAFLFVVGEGRTAKQEVDRALSLTDPAKLIGTVLNGARNNVDKPKYYYANQ